MILEEALRQLNENEVNESQAQEIKRDYDYLSDLYDVNLNRLVYGDRGFMKDKYPEGFPDYKGDLIYSTKYWDEFVEWLKEKKGIILKQPDDFFEELNEDLNLKFDLVDYDIDINDLEENSATVYLEVEGVDDVSIELTDKNIEVEIVDWETDSFVSGWSYSADDIIEKEYQRPVLEVTSVDPDIEFKDFATDKVLTKEEVCERVGIKVEDFDKFAMDALTAGSEIMKKVVNKSLKRNVDLVDKVIERANESLTEDTVKVKDGKWVNKGAEGTHGTFRTKKAADAQRRAMFANGYHEDLNESADNIALSEMVKKVADKFNAIDSDLDDEDDELVRVEIDLKDVADEDLATKWNEIADEIRSYCEKPFKNEYDVTSKGEEDTALVTYALQEEVGSYDKRDDDESAFTFFLFRIDNDEDDYDEDEEDFDEELNEEVVEETYSDEELDDLVGKVFNQQKIINIYRRKKYDETKLFAHTACTKCGREKRVFLSNLINDPEKYGSCVCSDTNVNAKIDNAKELYNGTKKLSSNTSGYTGVSFVKTYNGQPYNKWRAYIEVDGKRTYLGDFDSKAKAIKARKKAGEKGIKWYKDNKNKLMKSVRKKSKKYSNSKYKDKNTKVINISAADLKD